MWTAGPHQIVYIIIGIRFNQHQLADIEFDSKIKYFGCKYQSESLFTF